MLLVPVWLLACCLLLPVLMLSGYWYLSGHRLVTGLLSDTAGTGAVWLLVSIWLLACCLLLPVLVLSGYWYLSGYWPAICCCRY